MVALPNNAPVNIPSGVRTFGPFDVPDGTTLIVFKLDRCTTATPTIWPNASTAITLSAYLAAGHAPDSSSRDSPDFIGGITANGGILIARDGSELTSSTYGCPLAAGVSRQVTFTLNVVNGPLRSNATITAS